MARDISAAEVSHALMDGRKACARRAWGDCFTLLSRADALNPLIPADLELLAMSAGLTDHTKEMLSALERLYHTYLDYDQPNEAARAAFWLGFRFFALGATGQATAWLQRAQHLVNHTECDSVVRGYLILPVVHQCLASADLNAAYTYAEEAVVIGERFADADLVTFARHLMGRVLIRQGNMNEGLTLIDECMLSASSGDLSPLMTGLVYCGAIATYQQVYAIERAREWTVALSAWCESQPQLVAFSGTCMVHRAEIMQLSGSWVDAATEAEHAIRYLDETNDRDAAAGAWYQRAEIYRMRGEFGSAEKAYSQAGRLGESQPGLALLRLAQGRREQAAASIRRVVQAVTAPFQRVRFLPATVEIMLSAGALEEAAEACCELERASEAFGGEMLEAMATYARGATELDYGNTQQACMLLRRSVTLWQRVDVPYVTARTRVLLGRACGALNDEDGAILELEAARAIFETLGAAPDLVAVATLRAALRKSTPFALTRREIEVLRLVAAGKTNRAIAGELFVSEKTVDRHMGNIFNKLDVPSRAAATASAYRANIL